MEEEKKESIKEGSGKPGGLSLRSEIDPHLTFVCFAAEKAQQRRRGDKRSNAFSFLKHVYLENSTDRDLFGATLEITFLPKEIRCAPIALTCLEKGRSLDVDSFDLTVDPAYLYSLSEAFPGNVHFALKDSEGTLLVEHEDSFSLLPIEESASDSREDVILASFATPNDDAVRTLSTRAAKILESKYGRSAFEGYQNEDPNEVIKELDALYLAIQAEAIHYSNPPASFEKSFQRVRLPSSVLGEKTATCIDFALLFASLAENVGIHPLLIIQDGHAFNGFWLVNDSFHEGLMDNSTLIENNAAAGFGKIALLNSVEAMAGSPANFAQATTNGLSLMTEGRFLYALDIAQCRNEGILPLPTPHIINGKTLIDYEEKTSADYSLPLIDPSKQGFIPNASSPKDKFELWEEKLLDLNIRNNLINVHLGGGLTQILTPDATSLWKAISENSHFNLVPVLSEPVHDPHFLAYLHTPETVGEGPEELLKRHALQVVSANGTPDKNLIYLARKANTEIEESGCNPLFLAIGAIKYYDNEKAAKLGKNYLLAPLILVPASLPRRKSGEFYTLDIDLDGLQFNTTAFEYFKRFYDLDFSAFNNLFSQKEETVDLQSIYNTIREKIASQSGWGLLENFVGISLFSFAHFVMWSDMRNYRDEFLKNEIVSSLVNGKKELTIQDSYEPAQLDSKVPSDELAIPLSADSSQIAAITSALKGESFILDGPPGTGKSQTIANMIVNDMFHGKTVLFVAEKEVALEVVKSRLDKLGLGHFCLQIHSAKANKKDVLSQLEEALKFGTVKNPEDFEKEAERIDAERRSLNATLANLHQSKSFFVSIYQAIVSFLEVEDYQGRYDTPEEYARKLKEEDYLSARTKLKEIASYGHSIGGYHDNPFIAFQSLDYQLASRDALFQELPEFLKKIQAFKEAETPLFKKGLSYLLSSYSNLSSLADIFSDLRRNPDISYAYLDNEEYHSKTEAIAAYLKVCLAYSRKKEDIALLFNEKILTLDETKWMDAYSYSAKQSFLKRLHGNLAILKALRPYALDKRKLRLDSLSNYLENIHALKNGKKELAASDPFCRFLYPNEENKTSGEIETDLSKSLQTASIQSQISVLSPRNGNRKELYSYFISLGEKPELLHSNEISQYLSSYSELRKANELLRSRYGFNFFANADSDLYLEKNLVLLKQALAQPGRLSEWNLFLNTLDQAQSLLPEALLNGYKEGRYKEDELDPIFRASLFYEIISLGLEEEKLGQLSSLKTDQEIALYKKELEHFATLSVEETAARVSYKYPSSTINYAQSSSVFQLRKLCASGGRGRSLRGIFDECGDLIHTLCPCFLMSPLSVAQYLEPDKHEFDAVIFDEASQIPTSEAVGALARGKAVIIAGDPKQMPPTNFFTSSLFQELDANDDELAYDDLESFLDDCLALDLPEKPLEWHYRSHHESLIAFSNSKFYDNSLLSFPSPENQTSRVTFQNVQGHYEKGRGINKEEAQAIVKEVMRRLRDPLLVHKSIGIVTFNEKQENLIEDLLQKEFDRDVTLNENPGGESIFVKNLENVQGDERDVILFSITYGPDAKNKIMPLNYGPLSREKGERRLNVAVSRARDEMLVYASCEPEDIRAHEAKNEGARYLKDFLLYAKNGVKALTTSFSANLYEPKTSVGDFLARDLRKAGFEVDTNVGSSKFRIDVGVKDPRQPNRYILGIITDSDAYASSPSCRDRNIVQPAMLERLHWRIYRLWSVEYLDHPQEIIKKIIALIENPEEKTDEKPLEVAPQAVFTPASEQAPVYPHKQNYPVIDYFQKNLLDLSKAILENEAPIALELLKKKLRSLLKITRFNDPLLRQLELTLRQLGAKSEKERGKYYLFNANQEPASYPFFREGGNRAIDEIPYEEIGNAAEDIILYQGELKKDDLIRLLNTEFGFNVLSEKNRTYLSSSLDRLLETKRNNLVLEGDEILLKKEGTSLE